MPLRGPLIEGGLAHLSSIFVLFVRSIRKCIVIDLGRALASEFSSACILVWPVCSGRCPSWCHQTASYNSHIAHAKSRVTRPCSKKPYGPTMRCLMKITNSLLNYVWHSFMWVASWRFRWATLDRRPVWIICSILLLKFHHCMSTYWYGRRSFLSILLEIH